MLFSLSAQWSLLALLVTFFLAVAPLPIQAVTIEPCSDGRFSSTLVTLWSGKEPLGLHWTVASGSEELLTSSSFNDGPIEANKEYSAVVCSPQVPFTAHFSTS